MDGIPALDLWAVVIEVFHSSKNTYQAVREITVEKKRSPIKCREVEQADKSEAQIQNQVERKR